MESSIVYGSAKIKAAPTFKCAQKKRPAARRLFAVFCSFQFPSFSRQKQRLQLVGFLKTNNSELYDFAASRCPNWKIERKACLIDWPLPPPPSVMRKFFGRTTRIECNIFISFEFSGKRELAFIYPYFELIFAKQEWGALLYSILYFINNRQQRWAKLQNIVFSQGSLKQ